MAASLRNRSFTNLADKNDSVLNDDWVHGALETWKIKGKTANGGKWDWKGKIKHSQQNGQLQGALNDEVKIQFPYDRYYFWLGTRRNGDLKVHVDLGNVTLGGKDVNLFTNLKTTIGFKKFAFRFGYNYFGNGLTLSQRVQTHCGEGCPQMTWNITNRLWARKKDFIYGLVTSINHNLQLSQYDAIIGYERDNTNVYLEHTTPKDSAKINAGTLTAVTTYTRDNNTFGVEIANNFQTNKVAAALAIESRLTGQNATAKAKINNKSVLDLAYKRQINKQLNVTTSGSLDLSKGAKAVDFSKIVPIPFGVQFELNV